MHEYGHIMQSRNYGVAYLFCIGVPSLRSAASHNDHKNFGDDVWMLYAKDSHPTYGFLGYSE